MNERISIADKKPEAAKENKASQAQKSDSSQSINSPVDRILFLQRTIGNQAVARLIESGALQAKFRIGKPGDIYEQEADRVADQIMQMHEPCAPQDENRTRKLKCPKCEEGMHRQPLKTLQARGDHSSDNEVTPEIESDINSLIGSGEPLPESTRAFFEPRFGYDFSQVRVHADARAAEAAQVVDARAFTVGKDVVFGEGEYAPWNTEGKRLLVHELTHVTQQSVSNSFTRIQRAEKEDITQMSSTEDWAKKLNPDELVEQVNIVRKQLLILDPKSTEYAVALQNLRILESEAAQRPSSMDAVLYNGSHLIIYQGGKETLGVNAVSGHPGSKEFEKGVGPIPDGTYTISPHINNSPVNRLQSGVCGANPIGMGYQELSSTDQSPCDDPSNHYCTVACPTPTDPGRKCFTPVDCWGKYRIKIEGSVVVKKSAGGKVTRSGFYIHGGNHSVAVTSGCIKVFDDSVFAQMRKFKGAVPLVVKKGGSASSAP